MKILVIGGTRYFGIHMVSSYVRILSKESTHDRVVASRVL